MIPAIFRRRMAVPESLQARAKRKEREAREAKRMEQRAVLCRDAVLRDGVEPIPTDWRP